MLILQELYWTKIVRSLTAFFQLQPYTYSMNWEDIGREKRTNGETHKGSLQLLESNWRRITQ